MFEIRLSFPICVARRRLAAIEGLWTFPIGDDNLINLPTTCRGQADRDVMNPEPMVA
jgi:hypothetical protein